MRRNKNLDDIGFELAHICHELTNVGINFNKNKGKDLIQKIAELKKLQQKLAMVVKKLENAKN